MKTLNERKSVLDFALRELNAARDAGAGERAIEARDPRAGDPRHRDADLEPAERNRRRSRHGLRGARRCRRRSRAARPTRRTTTTTTTRRPRLPTIRFTRRSAGCTWGSSRRRSSATSSASPRSSGRRGPTTSHSRTSSPARPTRSTCTTRRATRSARRIRWSPGPDRNPIVGFLTNVQTWYNQQMATILSGWKTTTDAMGGNLFDNTIIPFVTEVAATGHEHVNMPAMLFGGKALGFKQGQYLGGQTIPTNVGSGRRAQPSAQRSVADHCAGVRVVDHLGAAERGAVRQEHRRAGPGRSRDSGRRPPDAVHIAHRPDALRAR